MNKLNHTNTIKNDRFPSSLFLVYFLVLLLMSGIHTGIIVGMNALGWNKIIQVILPLGYWTVVAVGLTLFTKNVIRKSYEKPMHDLADATKKVAEGDFSVYIPLSLIHIFPIPALQAVLSGIILLTKRKKWMTDCILRIWRFTPW